MCCNFFYNTLLFACTIRNYRVMSHFSLSCLSVKHFLFLALLFFWENYTFTKYQKILQNTHTDGSKHINYTFQVIIVEFYEKIVLHAFVYIFLTSRIIHPLECIFIQFILYKYTKTPCKYDSIFT